MKKKFSLTEKTNGELACRQLSSKAFSVIETTDPLDIYEKKIDIFDNDDNYVDTEKRYYVRGVITGDDLTFAQLDELLQEWAY